MPGTVAMQERNSKLYLVKREAQRWVITPSALLADLIIVGFGAIGIFMLYVATRFLRRAGAGSTHWLLGAIVVVAASLYASWAIRAWRTRHKPLSIESSGRVSYGDRELCGPGTVRAVCIAPSPGGEAGE
jgi:hypothetical protein